MNKASAGREEQGADEECPSGTRHLLDWVHITLRPPLCLLRDIGFKHNIKRKLLFPHLIFLIRCRAGVLLQSTSTAATFTLPLQVFTVPPNYSCSFSNPLLLRSEPEQRLEHQALEWSTLRHFLLLWSNVCLCILSGHEQLLCLTRWFLYQSWRLAVGHRLDIHTVMNGVQMRHLNTRCSFLHPVKFGGPSSSFCWGPLCAPVPRLHCSLFPIWFYLSLMSFPRSVFHLSSTFPPSPLAAILCFWLCSLNPLTHSVQHACKGWANNTAVSLWALHHCCTCKYYSITVDAPPLKPVGKHLI